MRAALMLARRGEGRVAPNPAVGCIIVRDGLIVGQGRTQDGGRPHAEAVALAEAGGAANGATAYVTLEPCAHHGKTPPCADALIDAGLPVLLSLPVILTRVLPAQVSTDWSMRASLSIRGCWRKMLLICCGGIF